MRPLIAPIGQGLAWQRGHLAEWVPVCLAVGIGGYFMLRFEPGPGLWIALGGVVALLALAARLLGENWRPMATALILVAAGAGLAGLRAHMVAGPVLTFNYYGSIEGRIVVIDRSASDAVRLTLDHVVLERMAPASTPDRVRVSLHGVQGYFDPEPGLTIILTGHLSPSPGPVEPGGFDFQRQAWFQRLGAVGYTNTPVLVLEPARPGGMRLAVNRVRARIANRVRAALPGDTGAFAAAVTTGDRSSIGLEVIDDLRRSNLAHLLAISGLHMGLLTGLIFSLCRFGLTLWSRAALRLPVKKLSALAALVAGAAYLALSGGNVATLRAFVMVTVMLAAVLLDRRAVTLRAVAVAATIILVMTPEALLGPGFQMSFAATVGLVAAFRGLQDANRARLPGWLRPIVAIVLSSAIAGLATAPFAAAHFNRFTNFGLIANVLSVPAMGLVVMPGGLLALVLAPFGLAGIGLAVMAAGIDWILHIAHWVAHLPDAQTHIPAPPPIVLPLVALGALFAILWQARPVFRAAGLAAFLAAMAIWSGAERPQLLISETGGLVGIMTERGRVLNKPRGEGFAALSWLENDGDGADQETAFARAAMTGKRGDLRAELPGLTLAHITGRGAGARARSACALVDLVVVSTEVPDPPGPCLIVDAAMLNGSGALAVTASPQGVVLRTARDVSGARLWNSASVRRSFGD